MKHYSLYTLIIFLFLLTACKKEEVHKYLGNNYIQFAKEENEGVDKIPVFSFAYSPEDVMLDTIWLNAQISGDIVSRKRYYKVRQAVHYQYVREYDNEGVLISEVLEKTPQQAIPNVHYVPFDDAEYLKYCYVDNNKVNLQVPVILKRDPSLKDTDFLLSVEFIDSDDFEVGDYELKKYNLYISDNVSYPEFWPEGGTTINSKFNSLVFGKYGPVKHRLMIQVTGKPWDDTFMEAVTYEERLIYKNICIKALDDINKERADKGEPPLMEDPAFVYGPVKFN